MNMDEQQIIALYRAVNQAMVAKDIDKLDRILADDMHLVHMTGYDQTKDEWFAQIRSEQMRYYSTKEENIKDIKIEGNKASFIGQSRVDARIMAHATLGDYRSKIILKSGTGNGLLFGKKRARINANYDALNFAVTPAGAASPELGRESGS